MKRTGVPVVPLPPACADFYEQVAVPVVVVEDFGAQELAFNTAAKEFFGLTPEAERFFIKQYYRLANRDDLERGFGALMDGREASLPVELRRTDGVWQGATLIARPDPPGKSPSVGAVITVVLAAASAAEDVRSSGGVVAATGSDVGEATGLRVFREALWSSRELAISISEDYTTDHLEWNGAFYELLGLDPDGGAPSSQAFLACVHPDDQARMVELGTAIATGEIDEWYNECRLITPAGELKYVNGHGLTALDSAGRRALVGILIDVTEARTRAAEAKSALTDLEQMTASVSHDLRAPVRHLESFCEMMTESFGDRLEGDDAVVFGYAKESIGKLSGMIQAMVEFSRLPKSIVAPAPVNLRAVVERLLAGRFAADAGRIRLGELPTVVGDAALLSRLLVHVMDNAVKFSGGRPDTPIDIGGATTDENYAVIEITDRGVGFEERYADKLFQMFQRLHSADEFPGFGTGLAIADRIAHLHRGRLSGTSADGRTTFALELPVSRAVAAPAAAGTQAHS